MASQGRFTETQGGSRRSPNGGDRFRQRLPATGRRLLNVLVAGVGLIATAPLMLLVAVAIRLTSPGPVIYRQVRIGLNRRNARGGDRTDGVERRGQDLGGRPFILFKFRTMHWKPDSPQIWAHADDPRVTPVGRILRRHRLDELPQLLNVLRGDMNVVGPRPEQPQIFAHLSRRIRRYGARQGVLPGITGLAQVELPYDRSVHDVRRKVHKDLEYIRNESLWNDVKIMASTVGVMLTRRGAH